MTIDRFLIRRKLKPENVADYIHHHQNVPPDLMSLYRRSGIQDVSCFLDGNDLVVYIQVDRELYEKERARLAQEPVEASWQFLMATFNDPAVPIRNYEEVFRMF
jgi:L-rhamnose mutarotase